MSLKVIATGLKACVQLETSKKWTSSALSEEMRTAIDKFVVKYKTNSIRFRFLIAFKGNPNIWWCDSRFDLVADTENAASHAGTPAPHLQFEPYKDHLGNPVLPRRVSDMAVPVATEDIIPAMGAYADRKISHEVFKKAAKQGAELALNEMIVHEGKLGTLGLPPFPYERSNMTPDEKSAIPGKQREWWNAVRGSLEVTPDMFTE